jgi:hypothetical protein
MNCLTPEPTTILLDHFPTMFSVSQITRDGDKFIRRLNIDAPEQTRLRRERIGLFLEGFLGLETILGRLMKLAHREDLQRLVVTYSTQIARDYVYELLLRERLVPSVKRLPLTWDLGCMTFTSVEALNKFRTRCPDGEVSTVFLLDSYCMVHHARTMQLGTGKVHDRPSLVGNFLIDQATEECEPLLVVMTRQRAIGVNTLKMARMYNRETWYYCDGMSMKFPER